MKVSFATLRKHWANKLPIRSCPISLALNFRGWKRQQRSRKIQWLLLSLYSPSHMFMVFSYHATWYSRGFCVLCQAENSHSPLVRHMILITIKERCVVYMLLTRTLFLTGPKPFVMSPPGSEYLRIRTRLWKTANLPLPSETQHFP